MFWYIIAYIYNNTNTFLYKVMIENILGVGLDIPLLGKNTNFYCYKNKLQFTNKGFLLKDGIYKK